MKKTLMALAVGAAFAAPSAFADVTISGAINMGIEYLNVDSASAAGTSNTLRTAGGESGVNNFGVSTNYTNITISSVDDLGGGLKLDFAAQIAWNTANNSGLSNRNSHIGLVGDHWGGVWYGSNENIYERYFYSIDPLDGAAGLGGNLQFLGNPGAGSVFDACNGSPVNCPGDRAGFYRRDEQVIWYDSPSWAGLTFGAAIGTNYAKDNPDGATPWQWQAGVKYVGPTFPLQAWAAYAKHEDYFGLADITGNTAVPVGANASGPYGTTLTSQAGVSSSDQGMQLGIGYTLGDIFIFGNYERLKYKIDGIATTGLVNDYRRDAWSVGTKWNLASGYVGAQFMMAFDGKCDAINAACNADGTGAWGAGVGYYHTMSRQTQLYTVGSYIDNDSLANYRTAGIGNAASSRNIGGGQWGLGVGIKHSF